MPISSTLSRRGKYITFHAAKAAEGGGGSQYHRSVWKGVRRRVRSQLHGFITRASASDYDAWKQRLWESWFLDVAGKYDTARPVGEDFNDFNSGDKYARWPKYIDPNTGRRSDAAHAFVYSQSHNPNLVVETEMRVVRILFEGTKAVGVEYIDACHTVRWGLSGLLPFWNASGIGSREVLQSNGISQLVDLPGVGDHYMDHNIIFTQYHASEEVETIDDVFYGTPDEMLIHEAEWTKTGQGLLSHNGFNGGGKLRPTAEELEGMGPGFKKRWDSFFARSPDKPVVFLGSMAADDAAIDDYHRRTVGTAWHACGTCAMKSRESGGVVDSNLNVYGTTNLKVAGTSLFDVLFEYPLIIHIRHEHLPRECWGHTYNTALAIGLKAAEIIAKDLGLNL
ncbi:hypothetical protein BKA70DRAFT_1525728 [Coprinopsis sp. MPI-PUGE-AT-0042]|nr:hypothetical protein BKA70DRAFT_1525728 [Coprinopsis sp. MPI-PUGE-AT-0042]